MSRLCFSTSPTIWARSVLLCRLVLATEGPAAAAAELQRALLHARPEAQKQLFRITAIVASELAKANYFPAALKHFELAIGLDSSAESVRPIRPCFFEVQCSSLSLAQRILRSGGCARGARRTVA